MVQVAVDEIVDVIAVGHRLVSAAGPVNVFRVVCGAGMALCAAIGICRSDFEDVAVVVIAVRMEQIAVTQVVRVARVFDGGVAAFGAVMVIVVVVPVACRHTGPRYCPLL
jgi:hypothetical protein